MCHVRIEFTQWCYHAVWGLDSICAHAISTQCVVVLVTCGPWRVSWMWMTNMGGGPKGRPHGTPGGLELLWYMVWYDIICHDNLILILPMAMFLTILIIRLVVRMCHVFLVFVVFFKKKKSSYSASSSSSPESCSHASHSSLDAMCSFSVTFFCVVIFVNFFLCVYY